MAAVGGVDFSIVREHSGDAGVYLIEQIELEIAELAPPMSISYDSVAKRFTLLNSATMQTDAIQAIFHRALETTEKAIVNDLSLRGKCQIVTEQREEERDISFTLEPGTITLQPEEIGTFKVNHTDLRFLINKEGGAFALNRFGSIGSALPLSVCLALLTISSKV